MMTQAPPIPKPAAYSAWEQGVSRNQIVALGVILAVAGFFRFDQLTTPSLWVDEIWSIEMSMGRGSAHDHIEGNVVHFDQIDLTSPAIAPPWWKIWAGMTGVPYPPLYHIVLRWWMDLFGNGAAATRTLSVLFSLASIPILFDICRLLHGPRIALLAAAMMAVSPAQLDFAQQVRSYVMLIFLALACADALVRIEMLGLQSRRLVALALLSAATMLTHYFAAGLLLGLAVYALMRLRGKTRLRAIGAFAAGAVLFAVSYGYPFYQQLHTLPALSADFLPGAHGDNFISTMHWFISVPARLLLSDNALYLPWVRLSLLLIAGIGAVLPIVRFGLGRRDLLLWIVWFWAAAGFVVAWDLVHRSGYLLQLRYSILASPAVYAAIASFDWPPRRRLRDLLALAFITWLALVSIQWLATGVKPVTDCRQFAADVDRQIPADDWLVFYNNNPWHTPGAWYMCLKFYCPQIHHPWVVLYRAPSRELLAQLSSRHSIWLIGDDPLSAGRLILPGWKWNPAARIESSAGQACEMLPPTGATTTH
jgi:uncharacterized membrane protein